VDSDLDNNHFDVVVVGAGSAGCASTARLVEQGARVCLVEAGPDYGPHRSGRWPPELLDAHKGPGTHDWGFTEVSCARVVGGCSAHNYCMAVWGPPEDYDAWGKAGNRGWAYERLRPLMRRVEAAVSSHPYATDELASWHQAFAAAAGAKPHNNVNVKDGVRWNAAFAFLDPVRGRGNLEIRSNLLADRLTILNAQARALVCRRGRELVEIRADRFLLTTGAFGSPLLLMRSGIGPAAELKRWKVPMQAEIPGVGENLHDHPGVAVEFEPSQEAVGTLASDVSRGRFWEAQVIIPSRSRGARSGFDLHLVPFQTISGFDVSLSVLAYNLAPLSRGRVTLGGKYPRRKPAIDFRFLSEARDADVLVDGVLQIRRLASKTAPAEAIEREGAPGKRISSEAGLRAYVRHNVEGYSHPVGTCKMGPSSDEAAVVDATGRVRGIGNLFVADASIMPVIPRANPNLTCMLIGLKVADAVAKT
jgi:choline dehydrogenase